MRVVFAALVGVMVLVGLVLATPLPASAQTQPVDITSVTYFCDRVDITLNTTGLGPSDNVELFAATGFGIGQFPSTNNPHTITVLFELPLNEGDPVTVSWNVPSQSASGALAPQPCSGSGAVVDPPTPSETPTEPPTETETASPEPTEPTETATPDPNGAAPWPGFTDGRLNPDPAEDFSIFCTNGQIQVFVDGNPLPVATIDVGFVQSLPDSTPSTTNDLSISRNGDTVNIQGPASNNGGWGSKSFSLSECESKAGVDPAGAGEDVPLAFSVEDGEPTCPPGAARPELALSYLAQSPDVDGPANAFRIEAGTRVDLVLQIGNVGFAPYAINIEQPDNPDVKLTVQGTTQTIPGADLYGFACADSNPNVSCGQSTLRSAVGIIVNVRAVSDYDPERLPTTVNYTVTDSRNCAATLVGTVNIRDVEINAGGNLGALLLVWLEYLGEACTSGIAIAVAPAGIGHLLRRRSKKRRSALEGDDSDA